MAGPRLLAARSQRVALAFSCLSLALLGFLPLFGGFTYEFALGAGLLAPTSVALGTALDPELGWLSPRDALRRGLSAGAVHALASALIALGHGLLAGQCDPFEQWQLFGLGPALGTVLGGASGALAGVVANIGLRGSSAKALAVLLALAGPLGGVGISLLRYYQSPIIFAFDPFFGYFAGALYDTELDGVERLLSYRAGSFGVVLAWWGLSGCLEREPDGRLRWRLRDRPFDVARALTGVILGVAVTAQGERLGHFQTEGSIRQELGRVASSTRCEVVYAGGILQRDAHALARDCDAHVAQLEAFFETTVPERITVFLFQSDRQKARLMGARDVYIAKPWRHEVYLQTAAYPHPVLGHELAHVVAGAFANGPFKVAGPLGGWLPDPGRIEGYAEAAANREGEELSPLEWAKAMRDLALLPPLERVFKLSFFGENASKAYTVAGAFVGWLRAEHGAAALRDWYAGKSLVEATREDLATLERKFHQALDALRLEPAAMDIARARFDRPSVFGRRCPHEVDALFDDAGRALGDLDPERARELYGRVLLLDPAHAGARLGLGQCALRAGELAASRSAFDVLSQDPTSSKLLSLSALERAGDVALLQGDVALARERFERAAQGHLDEDALRNLDVKRWIDPAMDAQNPARRAIVALLVGDPEQGSDWGLAAEALARWSLAEPKLGLADYLLGKNHFQRGRWQEAAERLDRALERQLPLPRVRREALRTRLLSACALGQKGRAKAVFQDYAGDARVSPHRRASVRRLAERCGALAE